MIPDDLAAFIESGTSVLVGTRDAQLFPDATRALGPRVLPGGEEVALFLPEATSAVALANLRDNGRIAVTTSRPIDHRTYQLKGRVASIRRAEEADRPVLDRYRCAFASALAEVGLPPRLTLRMAHWPCQVVRFRVEHLYVQTPGPGAGEPLTGAATRPA